MVTQPVLTREQAHRPDALGGTSGRVERTAGAKQLCRVRFALRDDAFRFIEGVRALDFREVERLNAEHAQTFVAGHVESRFILL